MSDFDQLRAACPALAQAGIEAAQIAEKDIQQALKKLSAISTGLIRMIFYFEGLEDSANVPPALSRWIRNSSCNIRRIRKPWMNPGKDA